MGSSRDPQADITAWRQVASWADDAMGVRGTTLSVPSFSPVGGRGTGPTPTPNCLWPLRDERGPSLLHSHGGHFLPWERPRPARPNRPQPGFERGAEGLDNRSRTLHLNDQIGPPPRRKLGRIRPPGSSEPASDLRGAEMLPGFLFGGLPWTRDYASSLTSGASS